MKKSLLLLILFCTVTQLFGQQFWNKKNLNNFKTKSDDINFRKSIPSNYNIYSLDVDGFSSFLKSARTENIIELPNAQGVMGRFYVRESSNLAPELSAKYPMIRSYSAHGIDDPTAMAKIDFGTRGLHAIVFSGEHSTLYIDPYTKDKGTYMVYQRKDLMQSDKDFMCKVEESNANVNGKMSVQNMRNANDGMLRTFRLALVCTGEYSQFHLTQQGVGAGETDAVKKAAILSAMNTTMNRVNGVFEKDLGVKMEIVANNDAIIYLDAATDGLSNNSPGALLSQTQTKCDTEIGSANYDIGHVFCTTDSGVAGLGVVCFNGQKGRGVTGQPNPINDPFDIDYVAHEMGHQYGANHTQNNNCQRNFGTAVEPGSASTIMGYAGICSPNVQSNSDDHFHTVSIGEMWSNLQSSATCAVQTSTGNNVPTADAGADFTIPKSTPFVLRGSATDADGMSSLTYNWEQIDNEIGSMPPQPTNTSGPMFRSISSKASPDRYMPELATVVAGNTSTTWEVLPSVARDMEFAFTVRDNHIGGGNSARDDKIVTVVDADPFIVTVPNLPLVWDAGSTQTIQWDKGTSDVAPINCQMVNIKLSTDGGLTFPITILSNTPNDGSQDVVIPNNPSVTARIMVEAADNIFYNVSPTNFTINEATASVEENALQNFSMYPNPSQGVLNIRFDRNNSDEVNIQFYDLRGRSVKKYSFINDSARFAEEITINTMASGIYLVKIQNGNKTTIKKLILE